ncbi:MAG: hypothetical protein ACFCUE_01555 [Candidatus Bathyarchaeia archaeon]
MSATVIALIVAGIILTSATTALLTFSVPIPTNGTVTPTSTPTPTPTPTPTTTPTIPTPPPKTVEIAVYSDSACTNEYTSITWDSVAPGGSTTKTVYVKNEGTETVTLQLTTSNLSPAEAVGKISVNWNREGQTLAAGASVSATLTLNVDGSISGVTNFDIDVTITGEAP